MKPCNSKSLWVIDSVDFLLCVGKDQGRNPNSLFFRVRQGVHVDVGLHVVEHQTEVIPCQKQAELSDKSLTYLINLKNCIQINLEEAFYED